MDRASVFGLLIAVLAIVGGNTLEGGHISAILQPTAALIVLGGTLGAVTLQFPSAVLFQALRSIRTVFQPMQHDHDALIDQILGLAAKARREGIIAIERDAANIEDVFLKRAVELAVDGTDAKTLRAALEAELVRFEEEGEAPAKVLESAGGYAPTVGILGAVLGLIHVMENLSDPSRLGSGIATAFVATVYGVGSANLLLLPMAGKLKARHRQSVIGMELVVEGVIALAEGENPRLIARRLHAYQKDSIAHVVAETPTRLRAAA